MAGGFCPSAPGESTQVIRGKRRPMSPLAVQSAHLQAVSLHSLTHGRQPAKRARVNHHGHSRGSQEGEAHSQKDWVSNPNDQLPANPSPSLLQLHLSQAACFFSNEGYSRLFKSERHPRTELKLTTELCTEDYSLQF